MDKMDKMEKIEELSHDAGLPPEFERLPILSLGEQGDICSRSGT